MPFNAVHAANEQCAPLAALGELITDPADIIDYLYRHGELRGCGTA